MPRTIKPTEEQIAFLIKYASKGGNWLAKETGFNRAAIYQWGTNNGVSFKRKDYPFKTRFSKWPRPYRKSKEFLVKRDGLNCHYCGIELSIAEVQIDHIRAKARGGTDSPDNLVISCARCNNFKSTCCYQCPEFRDWLNDERHAV